MDVSSILVHCVSPDTSFFNTVCKLSSVGIVHSLSVGQTSQCSTGSKSNTGSNHQEQGHLYPSISTLAPTWFLEPNWYVQWNRIWAFLELFGSQVLAEYMLGTWAPFAAVLTGNRLPFTGSYSYSPPAAFLVWLAASWNWVSGNCRHCLYNLTKGS